MENFDAVSTMDAMMQSAVIEVIRKDASLNPANKVTSFALSLMIAQAPSINF
jgi:hypothetical protein